MKFSHIFSENALKLTYGNVEFQKFPGVRPPDPLTKGRGEDLKLFAPPILKILATPLGNNP
jgi:hypothetical protein